MRCSMLFTLTVMMFLGSNFAVAIDLTWDGGDGEWIDSNWNGGEALEDAILYGSGSNGWKGENDGDMENLIIPSGTVTYDADFIANDFQMLQGSTLTIGSGAVWQQLSNDDWAENRWTEMDLSVLNIDGGTFRRAGVVRDEGGGALIFGSWKGDDAFAEPETEDAGLVNEDLTKGFYQDIRINLTNGGRIENEGQLWFGGWGDVQEGTIVTMTINDGHLDLTGGDVVFDDELTINADLVFTNHYFDEEFFPSYAINFTGPGSITVDESGIAYEFIDDGGDFPTDPVTYEELWEFGVLQANGTSGLDGVAFSSFFSTSGALGSDNYTLISNIGNFAGDFDGDGARTGNDIDLLSAEVRAGTNMAEFDVNGDGSVDNADRLAWITEIQGTTIGDANLDGTFDSSDFVQVFQIGEYEDGVDDNSGWSDGDWTGDQEFDSGDFVAAFQAGGYVAGAAPQAVPEPSGCMLLLIGGFGLLRRRR